MYCTVHSGCLLSPLYSPIMMHIKFLLPTEFIKQPTRSQELPNAICLPKQGNVEKFFKKLLELPQMQAYQPSPGVGLPTSFLANS